MVAQKRKFLQNADQLSREITVVQLQLTTEQDVGSRELLKDRLSLMTQHYWNIEKMPTWPVAVETKRLFKRNNLALLLPLFIALMRKSFQSKTWQQVIDVMETAIK